MRDLMLPTLCLLAVLGCEPTTPSGSPSPTDDTGDAPRAAGVQVGSEGILDSGCDTEIVEERAVYPDLAFSGADVLERLAFPSVTLDGATPGTLTVAAQRWTHVREGACPASLVGQVTAELDVSPVLAGSFAGYLSVGTDGDVQIALAAAEWTGDATPRTFDPGADVRVRLDGAVTRDLAATLAFEGCVGDDCSLEGVGALTSP
ncbi:MAG: hypothetical protein H6736_07205 [Alphaproteobacteria bacterium]|nr:hypothetical protein [Alphaproteobacteria bacterium]MCB9691585.1 hypothetical protein [Alphaproteobacteria bacterium]